MGTRVPRINRAIRGSAAEAAAGPLVPKFIVRQMGKMLQTAGRLIALLIAGQVVQPLEPWIKEYLRIPAEPGLSFTNQGITIEAGFGKNVLLGALAPYDL